MAELEVGDPRKLSVDVGPVITAEARDAIVAHIEAMRARGFKVTQAPLGRSRRPRHLRRADADRNRQLADVEREVFGPVLHVLRFKRERARRADRRRSTPPAMASRSACTRASTRRSRESSSASRPATSMSTATSSARPSACSRSAARGLSGTGPKAGGPLYLPRLAAEPAPGALEGVEGARRGALGASASMSTGCAPAAPGRGRALHRPHGALAARRSRRAQGTGRRAQCLHAEAARPDRGARGERRARRWSQIGAILATGNDAVVNAGETLALQRLPPELAHRITHGLLSAGGACRSPACCSRAKPTRSPTPCASSPSAPARSFASRRSLPRGSQPVRITISPIWSRKCAISTNIAAAGGNASLMTIG